jgi:hypothetical protein
MAYVPDTSRQVAPLAGARRARASTNAAVLRASARSSRWASAWSVR